MKSIINSLMFMLLGVGYWGCTEEEDIMNEPVPTTSHTIVNFALENQTLPESGDPLKVSLTFDRAAAVNGSVSVRLSGDAVYQQNYTTAPVATGNVITLHIEKGQATAYVTVTPVNDEDSLGNQTITFTLENPSNGFKLGNKVTSVVELVEDDTEPGNGEEEATIEFGENFIHLSEGDVEGFDISMLMQGSVTHTEIVTLAILPTEGFVYGTDYVTDPVAIQNSLNLEINPGVEDVKFRVIPINDQQLSGNFELKISISNTSDGIKKGTQTDLTVQIEEDDVINPLEIFAITDLRNLFESYEGDWYLSNNYYIEGVVTSDKNVINEKIIYIQDATGGIMLVFNAPSMLHPGDKVQLNLKDANGVIIDGQKAMVGVTDRVGITLGHNFIVEPELITLDQLTEGNYQGKRVRVQNVTFPDADGTATWQGVRRITDGTAGKSVTTYATAGFSQQALPTGKVTVTGIVGAWNSIQPQHYPQDVVVVR